MAKITVILPVFNNEKYIQKSVESVLNQTFTDFELIIVNDGSTDNTQSILDTFTDSRITIITQENSGPGAARNRALDCVSSDYVMFLDSDDWFDSDALRIAYREAVRFNTDLTFYQMINYDGEKYYPNDWFDLKVFDESFEDRVFFTC